MDRKKPIVVGTDKRGELVWGFVPMARWQMIMFPIKYVGDFAGFWYRKLMEAQFGIPADDVDAPSMDISKRHRYGKKSNRRPTWGD